MHQTLRILPKNPMIVDRRSDPLGRFPVYLCNAMRAAGMHPCTCHNSNAYNSARNIFKKLRSFLLQVGCEAGNKAQCVPKCQPGWTGCSSACGHAGAWAGAKAIKSLADCIAKCKSCPVSTCTYVSFSLLNDDCSWCGNQSLGF